MDRERSYDSQWKEVKDINAHVLPIAYLTFVFRGLSFLMFTWTTVVLLGGFVSMIDKKDFWNLTMITLLQIIWIDDKFNERLGSAFGTLSSSFKVVKNILTCNWQLSDNARSVHPGLSAAPMVVQMVVPVLLSLVHNVVLFSSIMGAVLLVAYGLFATAWISIDRLKERDHYGDKDEGRTNMDPAHNLLYAMCLVQFALVLYRVVLVRLAKVRVKQVSQAYGFPDNDQAVQSYSEEIMRGCWKNPSSARERNLVTYALELMESNESCFYGTVILDRLITRQHSDKHTIAPGLIQQEEENHHLQQQQLDMEGKTGAPLVKKDTTKKEDNKEESNNKRDEIKKKWPERKKKRHQHHQTKEEIIVQQRRVIKRLIGSASSTHILQKLFETLDWRHASDRRVIEAAARVVEHVADVIHLEQFPRGIQCISSLINTFEEYHRPQPYNTSSSDLDLESESESEMESNSNQPSSSEVLHDYENLVLTGLRILRGLAGNEDNCAIISNTKHLVTKIMAPASYDLVHRACHSAWSTMVVEESLGVLLRLIVTAKGDTGAELRQQIASDERVITTIKEIVTCEQCKGGELQMKAMQILTQLCMDDTANIGNLIKVLVSTFVSSNGSIRKTAGETLVVLFLGNKNATTLLPKEEHDVFVGDLAKILLQVGDDNTSRKCAAEILEHLCINYIENDEYLSTLKKAIVGVMPKVLGELLLGCGSTREEGKLGYSRLSTDVESQATTNNSASSRPRQNRHHKLHVALLSLCVSACEKLHLDINAISLGEGEQGDQEEGAAFRFAMKIVELNKDVITANGLATMKLTIRMVIESMKKLRAHGASVERADLKSLIDSLSRVSETMLHLEGSMVFAVGTTTTIPATADTLDSLVKQARRLYREIKDQDSEIKPTT